MEKCF